MICEHCHKENRSIAKFCKWCGQPLVSQNLLDRLIGLDEVKQQFFADDDAFCERSWGMSDDYKVALQHSSTMVRIGTAIFGPRIY